LGQPPTRGPSRLNPPEHGRAGSFDNARSLPPVRRFGHARRYATAFPATQVCSHVSCPCSLGSVASPIPGWSTGNSAPRLNAQTTSSLGGMAAPLGVRRMRTTSQGRQTTCMPPTIRAASIVLPAVRVTVHHPYYFLMRDSLWQILVVFGASPWVQQLEQRRLITPHTGFHSDQIRTTSSEHCRGPLVRMGCQAQFGRAQHVQHHGALGWIESLFLAVALWTDVLRDRGMRDCP
jgi:hypothetical protein